MDSRLAGYDEREFPTTPLGMNGSVLPGVLIDSAIEVLCQGACDFGRWPGARAVDEPARILVCKAVDPFTKGGIGKVQGVGDRVEPLPGF